MSERIKVFASTTETQGQRRSDFCFVPDGEVVRLPHFICSNEEVDGGCGCARSLCGIYNNKATTTMKVVEISYEHYLAIHEELAFGLFEYLKAASVFPIGQVVEYRNGEFCSR